MQGTIEVVSATGKGFRVVGQEKGAWYNKGKMVAEDFMGLKKGDVIEFNAPDGKWVTSWRKSDGSGVATSEPLQAAKVVFQPKQAGTGDETSNSISRGCAANAVLGSPYLATLLAGECPEETMKNITGFMAKVAEFVYGGKF